jgi:hypothetical protein
LLDFHDHTEAVVRYSQAFVFSVVGRDNHILHSTVGECAFRSVSQDGTFHLTVAGDVEEYRYDEPHVNDS